MFIDVNEAIQILKRGGVIGIPTDTVYGLAALRPASKQIYEIKKRDINKKLISFVKIGYKFDVDNFTNDLFKSHWPGNTTFIIKQNEEFVSFRIPNEPNVLNLLDLLDEPLLTTSANISGELPATSPDEFFEKFPGIPLLKEDVIITKSKEPSTILKIDENKIIKIR